MSFFTFSSDLHRHFARWLLVVVLLAVLFLFVMGGYLQPLYGDMTRIGFYSERQFGWSGRQVEFTRLQSSVPKSLSDKGEYDHYYDVLILGDSFSIKHPELLWQNYFALATGQSVNTLNVYQISFEQVLASREFREHPPKFLIFESVERLLPMQINKNLPACGQDTDVTNRGGKRAISLVAESPGWRDQLPTVTRHFERPDDFSDIKLNYVRNYLWHQLTDGVHHGVQAMPLNRPAPFSSAEKATLLVPSDELLKQKWWERESLSKMSLCIDDMRRRVESNGYTRFVLMVAPDKLTAYADYLQTPDLYGTKVLSDLSLRHEDIMPRLDKALRDAILSGELDVYFPDDSHWASRGEAIAADTLIDFLSRPAN